MTPVEKYFLGEKLQCSMGITLGFIAITIALWFFFQLKSDFYKGIGWPRIIIGGFMIAVCGGVVWRTQQDIDRVSQYDSFIYQNRNISL